MVLAVTSHGPDPLNAFANLYEISQKSEIFTKQPYMDTNVLRCYLVLHDYTQLGSDMSRSMAVLDEVRKTYGLHCALLPINSATGSQNDATAFFTEAQDMTDLRNAQLSSSIPWGAALSMEDVQRLRAYVRELITKSLVPFLESTVQHLGEHVAAQRKGLTGRLLGASRKLFTGRTGAATPGVDTSQGVYTNASTTAQTRRVADLAMHIRDYRLAVQMYEAVRRDYQSDQVTMYSAFSAEILSMARLLYSCASQTPPGPLHPLFLSGFEEFSSSRAGAWFALRATILYAHLQQKFGDHQSAAMAYLRAADSSDEMVRALLLEHASRAYLRMSRPHTRRSASALLRAASQYSSCGQKTLALQAFSRLQDYYESRHISLHDYTLFQKSILYHTLGSVDEALACLLPILHGSMPEVDESRLKTLVSLAGVANKNTASLPTPLIQTEGTRIVPVGQMGQMDDVPVAAVQEVFNVQLTFVNTFGVKVHISDLQFLFVTDDRRDPMKADSTVDTLTFAPYERSTIHVPVSLPTEGLARLEHMTYKLMDVLPVKQTLQKHGPRLNTTSEQKRSVMYGQDTSLRIHVREGIPRIQCTVSAPTQAMVGELVEVTLTFTNTSAFSAHDVTLTCSPAYLMPVPTANSELDVPWHIPSPAPFSFQDLAGHDTLPVCFHIPILTAGKECLTWQVCYHNEQGEMFKTQLQHEIHTLPVLEAQVSFKLARSVQPQYHLRMGIENVSDVPIEISGIAFVSPQWQMSLDFQHVSLDSHHTAQWLARGQKHQGLDTLHTTVELLRPFFQGRNEPVNPPDMHLQVSRLQQEALPLMDSNQIDVLVAWRAASGKVGETFVCGISLGFRDDKMASLHALDLLLQQGPSTRAMYAETQKEKQMAREQLSLSPLVPAGCPITVATGTLPLTVPGQPFVEQLPLYIRNESPWTLSCTLRLEPLTDTQPVPYAPWLGKTMYQSTVPGWSAEKVMVKVLIDSPGTYRLGDWRIEAHMRQGELLVRSFKTSGSFLLPFTVRDPA
ncbi:hypothetical protein MEQU1_001858 [Malassezia equina]|uniref:TPPC8 first Ig-like domain-containing protein n=1 Tax=Malassezia equina TaxID=1381935 RepID=A0AAF0J3P1_9BASI|nr:hypothetical protein MEQU1_001858 [Malassezia equina]